MTILKHNETKLGFMFVLKPIFIGYLCVEYLCILGQSKIKAIVIPGI